MESLYKLALSPKLKLLSAAILLISALLHVFDSALDPLYKALMGADLDVHAGHGFAIVMVLQHFAQGAREWAEKAQKAMSRLQTASAGILFTTVLLDVFDNLADPIYAALFGRDIDVHAGFGAVVLAIAHMIQAVPDLMGKTQKVIPIAPAASHTQVRPA